MELLDDETVSSLREVYAQFSGSSGSLGPDELGLVLRAIGVARLTRAEIDEMLSQLDASGKGRLDFPAFVHLMCSQLEDRPAEFELTEAFTELDCDGDGCIGVQDLVQAAAVAGVEGIDVDAAADILGEAKMPPRPENTRGAGRKSVARSVRSVRSVASLAAGDARLAATVGKEELREVLKGV